MSILDAEFEQWLIGQLPLHMVIKLQKLYKAKKGTEKFDEAVRLMTEAVRDIMGNEAAGDYIIAVQDIDDDIDDFRQYLDENGLDDLLKNT